VVAIACAALLTVEGALFLSGRQRCRSGWWLGVFLLLSSLIASGLAARLFAIRARLIYGPALQWTDPRITTPLTVATVLGSLLLVLTAYGGIRALSLVRSPAAPVAERDGASAWSFSWSLFVLAVMADVGAWTFTNGIVHWAETGYLYLITVPADSYDDLGLLPVFGAIVATVWGALVLLLPLSLLLVVLRRSGRAFPSLAERWLLRVATVASVLAAFFAAVDEELANFLLSNLWWTLQLAAWLIAGCAFVVAVVSIVREHAQRGARMPR
jgi:hypothetical protein